jgi:hypothetical protein
MVLSPKDVINEVLQLPSPLLLKRSQEVFEAITQTAARYVEKRLSKERLTPPSAGGGEVTIVAKRKPPFIPSEFYLDRDVKLIPEQDEASSPVLKL